MSYRIESSITIMAPPEVVWTTLQDVSRRLEWDARVNAVELLTPMPIGKGSRTRISYRMLGFPMHIDIEMIAWHPPLKSAVKGTIVGSDDTIGGSWHLTAHADGSTTWTTKLVLKSRGRFAWLREQLNGLVTKRLTVISQANLKRLIEAEYVGQGVSMARTAS